MRTYRLARMLVAFGVWVWATPLLILGAATTAHGQAAAEAGVEVLTRGPVHEAFAKVTLSEATPGVVISKGPPGPIEELPPDEKPEGANVAWIPGYWTWDDDRNDFIWVSGVWRVMPPDRQWVPGYWAPIQGGYQWTSGFWAQAGQTEVTYLPPPPEPVEAGPSSPQPADNYVWSPGCWVWHETRYAWQPGYWLVEEPDWVWVSAHYVWTPGGYVFVPGYWDHDIVHRGVMFAPVYYSTPVYTRPDYYYSPAIVIDLGVIATCLFVQPRYHHYYFGDYYDRHYEDRGFYPWYSKRATRYGYDPVYFHYRSERLRHDPDWDVHIDEQYRYRREHVDARPPQTLALQVNIIKTQKTAVAQDLIIGKSLAEATQSKTLPMRFTRLDTDQRKRIETQGREVHRFQLERQRLEVTPAAAKREKGAEAGQPIKVRLRESPVAASPVGKGERGTTPPALPTAPKPETRRREAGPEKPSKVEGRTRKIEAQPPKLERGVKPRKVEAKPEKAKPETKPVAPQTVTAKPPKVQERPRRVEAKPETLELQKGVPKPEQTKRGVAPGKAEPKRALPKPEMKPEEAEPKAQLPKVETKQQKGKQEQAPGAKGKKKKKGEEKPKDEQPR
jgi:hypothetical protein